MRICRCRPARLGARGPRTPRRTRGNGLEPWQHGHLGYFAIRVGARRLTDAATCLALIGENKAADIADEQARLVGALQHPLVTDDHPTVTRLLRRLAPTYEQLRVTLPNS